MQSDSAYQPVNPPHGPQAGVGLRHVHFQDVLQSAGAAPDFIEVHSENFFAARSAAQELLADIARQHPVSLHGTAMGIGSAAGIHAGYLNQLKILVERINPLFISDHACFCWSAGESGWRHAGDLLPVPMDETSLQIMSRNLQDVQQFLGRRMLVENIVSYIPAAATDMRETDFLQELALRTGCGLLIDLNNVLVNATNAGSNDPLTDARHWVAQLDPALVGEIHLAGCTPAADNDLIIDDHAQPVSAQSWALFDYAIQHLGPVATLIERDNNLPAWADLLAEAGIARHKLSTLQHTPREKRYVA